MHVYALLCSTQRAAKYLDICSSITLSEAKVVYLAGLMHVTQN